MLYRKPKHLKYTDMCIYIDTHIYTDNYDEQLVYQYLYLITDMFAKKGRYFDNEHDYEDFASQFASYVFMRLLSEKQYKLKEDGNSVLPKVKSVLNYIRGCIYQRRIQWERDYFRSDISDRTDLDYVESEYSFRSAIYETDSHFDSIEFGLCLDKIAKYIYDYLKRIPYYSDPIMFINIYVSCMLSFLNSITLNRLDKDRLDRIESNSVIDPEELDSVYSKYFDIEPILYHLDSKFTNYLKVLTKEIKFSVSKELSYSTKTYSQDIIYDSLLAKAEVNNDKVGDQD